MGKITRHGKKRLSERAGVTRGIAEKQIEKVLIHGIPHSKAMGNLKEMMENKYHSNYSANNSRFYGNKLYLFHNDMLITVLDVNKYILEALEENIEPEAYKAYVSYMNKSKEKKPAKDRDILLKVNEYASVKYRKNMFEATDVMLRTDKKILLGYISDEPYKDYSRFFGICHFLREAFGFDDVQLIHKIGKDGRYQVIEKEELVLKYVV